MADQELYYPFVYRYHTVCTVAMYGSNAPVVVKGHLVLRTYYTDKTLRKVDVEHTSEYVMDEVFFETNKVIREQLEDPYNGRRELIELSMPELGRQYRIIYNGAEIPSPRYDDQVRVLAYRDPGARGVAIIMKRDHNSGLTWLDENEAREIAKMLSE